MIHLATRHVIPAALSMLPPKMDTPAARAMLVAIGLQESKFLFRRQATFGPARGFWQFEKSGVIGIMKHRLTTGLVIEVLREMRYEQLIRPGAFQMSNIHIAIEDNDVLACVFARLLLYTVPSTLPARDEAEKGWGQYVEGWRPGKPHPETWLSYFAEAWERIEMTRG